MEIEADQLILTSLVWLTGVVNISGEPSRHSPQKTYTKKQVSVITIYVTETFNNKYFFCESEPPQICVWSGGSTPYCQKYLRSLVFNSFHCRWIFTLWRGTNTIFMYFIGHKLDKLNRIQEIVCYLSGFWSGECASSWAYNTHHNVRKNTEKVTPIPPR